MIANIYLNTERKEGEKEEMREGIKDNERKGGKKKERNYNCR